MKNQKLKPLPKVIYGRHQPERNDGTGPTFFATAETAAELAELGEIIEVGKYELIERCDVSAVPVCVPATARGRR